MDIILYPRDLYPSIQTIDTSLVTLDDFVWSSDIFYSAEYIEYIDPVSGKHKILKDEKNGTVGKVRSCESDSDSKQPSDNGTFRLGNMGQTITGGIPGILSVALSGDDEEETNEEPKY